MSSRCHFCQNLSISRLIELAREEFVAHEFPKHAFYQHYKCFSDLEASARMGCDFCQMILDCFRGLGRDLQRSEGRDHYVWHGPEGDIENSMYSDIKDLMESDVKIAIDWNHTNNRKLGLKEVDLFDVIVVQVGSISFKDTSRMNLGRPLRILLTITTPRDHVVALDKSRIGLLQTNPKLRSQDNFKLAKSWLEQCQNTHQKCLLDALPVLPTRVLAVEDLDKLRLVHSYGKRAKYAVLSHCWGGKIDCVTTENTFAPYQQAIPYHTLPANFKDAITITRQLDIPYLWIDSLCIIQDSTSDWEEESKKMALIYQNSTLTISAMASKGSSTGILDNIVSPIEPNAITLPLFPQQSGDDSCVWVQRSDYLRENLNHLETYSPLSRRGWTLQESMLSPRQLIYGAQQIYWQCPDGFESADAIPRSSPQFPVQKLVNDVEDLKRILYSNLLRQPPTNLPLEEKLLNEYYCLVQMYSLRQLSFDSDKLPAISGLASRFSTILNGTYVAGLWSSDLTNGLLWQRDNAMCGHVKSYRSPSWSWAVTNGTMRWVGKPLKKTRLQMRILDTNVFLRNDDDPYGGVQSAYIMMEGLTHSLIRSKQTVKAAHYSQHLVGGMIYDELEEGQNSSNTSPHESDIFFRDEAGKDLLSIEAMPLQYMEPFRDWTVDAGEFTSAEYMLFIVHGEYKDPNDEEAATMDSTDYYYDGRVVVGLVVRRVSPSSTEDVFERAGVFSLRNLFCHQQWIDTWETKKIKLI